MRPRSSLAWGSRCLALWIALVPAATCGAGSRNALLTSGQKLYSQHNEELVIRHFFEDRKDGFFVDVGAFVPIQTSTTYYLEKHLGWSGIAVDALALLEPLWKMAQER